MITIGCDYMGPEHEQSGIALLLNATMRASMIASGPWEVGRSPGVNVVFLVPGSLGNFGVSAIKTGRFSRKKKLLLVVVPVSPEVTESGGSIEYVMGALRAATELAAETFARKGAGEWPLSETEAVLERIRELIPGEIERVRVGRLGRLGR